MSIQFKAVRSRGADPDERCLICDKMPKRIGTPILRVRAEDTDLYYCLRCVGRAHDAVAARVEK